METFEGDKRSAFLLLADNLTKRRGVRKPSNLLFVMILKVYMKRVPTVTVPSTKYRSIDLLNHSYKIMSVVLQYRIPVECQDLLSD